MTSADEQYEQCTCECNHHEGQACHHEADGSENSTCAGNSCCAGHAPRYGAHNKTERPLAHYRECLAQADPEALSRKSGIAYDAESQCFLLSVLGVKMALSWPDGELSLAQEQPSLVKLSASLTILAMRLVLEGTLVPSSGKYIAYAQIPWGTEYLGAFTGRCIRRMAFMHKSAQTFKTAAQRLGGMPLQASADAAFEFEFVPGVNIQALFWERDDEFEPQAQLLFSDNISLAFTAEDVAVVGDVFLNALGAASRVV